MVFFWRCARWARQFGEGQTAAALSERSYRPEGGWKGQRRSYGFHACPPVVGILRMGNPSGNQEKSSRNCRTLIEGLPLGY